VFFNGPHCWSVATTGEAWRVGPSGKTRLPITVDLPRDGESLMQSAPWGRSGLIWRYAVTQLELRGPDLELRERFEASFNGVVESNPAAAASTSSTRRTVASTCVASAVRRRGRDDEPAGRVATGPNPLWNRNITYLPSRMRGKFDYLSWFRVTCRFPMEAGEGVIPAELLELIPAGHTGLISGVDLAAVERDVDGWSMVLLVGRGASSEDVPDGAGGEVTLE